MPSVLLASSLDLARSVTNPTVTIECEFGDTVVEGTRYTAAHHQKSGRYQGRHTGGNMPAPCNDPIIPRLVDGDTVLLSHLDLDSIGGAIRAVHGSGLFDRKEFWNLAEFVDTHGPHKMHPDHSQRETLAAWWAWLTENRPRPDRQNVVNVTEFVEGAYVVLLSLLFDGPSQDDPRSTGTEAHERLMEAGRAFLAAEARLNESSYRASVILPGDLVLCVRVADQFTNHLYQPPRGMGSGVIADLVLALNTKTGGVTLSVADHESSGVNARDLVQTVWRDRDENDNFLAGGHPGIAGCPRGRTMTEDDLWYALGVINRALR